MKKVRLDDELVAQGICADRADALRTCMAGLVSAGGERLTSAGMKVEPGIDLHVKGRSRYVGRGGLKLEGAIETFGIDASGRYCLDIGCSTGGFTDCLLKHNASRVVSVDVGRAQFDWSLRNDDRVTLLERTNITEVPAMELGPFELVVCDVSFTSIANIIDSVAGLCADGAVFAPLVKPQFEAAAEQVGEGGIVRDPEVRHQVLLDVIDLLQSKGFAVHDVCVSPIHGAKGNVEYFLTSSFAADTDTASAACNKNVREKAMTL